MGVMDWIIEITESIRCRQSRRRSFISLRGKGGIRYYAAGDSTLIYAETLTNDEHSDYIIYKGKLHWYRRSTRLTPAEEDAAYKALCDYLDEHKWRWRFSVHS
jgi:hypothetical protein